MQHARVTGNEWLVDGLREDRSAVAALCQSVEALDTDDVADVDAAVGALGVLADVDKQGLLMVSPELPSVLDKLASQCSDAEVSESITAMAEKLG